MPVDRISPNSYENFTIERIVISQGDQGYEISDSFASITITECMVNGLMSGSIVMLNTIDFLDSYMNPDGSEYIQICFFSKGTKSEQHKKYIKLFRIVSYDTIDDANTMNRGFITFYFESVGSVADEFIRISKSYKGVGTHFIVKDMLNIIGYNDDVLNIENTLYNKDIVVPNKSPLSVISYLVNHSQSGYGDSKGDSNFYFFENRDKINFVSGTTLVSKDSPVPKYVYDATVSSDFFNRVIKFQRHRGYNIRTQARDGAFGLTVMSNSLIDKQYRIDKIKPESIQNVYKPMNGDGWHGNVIEDGTNSCFVLSPEDHMYKFLNMGSTGNSIGINKINRSNLNAKSAFARIGGNTNLTTGDIIDLVVPSYNGKVNTRDSGKWLVFQITHVITRENYIMDLELISNSDIRRV